MKEKGGSKNMKKEEDRDTRVEKLLEELIGEAKEVVEQPVLIEPSRRAI